MKKTKWISVLVVLLVGVLTGLLVLSPFSNSTVYAETVPLQWDVNSADWNWNGMYIKYPTLTTNTVLEKSGYKIKEAFIQGPNGRINLPDAANKLTYTVQQTLEGKAVPVYSMDNDSAQSYYAWNRSGKSTSDWRWKAYFTRLDDSYNEFGENRYCASTNTDTFGMPASPGCIDNNLTLSGTLDPFMDDNGVWVEIKALDHTYSKKTVIKDEGAVVAGPEDLNGRMETSSVTVNEEDLVWVTPYLDRFIVNYTKDFSQQSPYVKNWPNYGAQMMVYFDAFIVDIETRTYTYPYTLEVTYERLDTSRPDLVPVNLTTTGSVKIDELKTYTYTFRNEGKSISGTSFVVQVRNRDTGQVVGQMETSELAKDAQLSGTFTFTATSQQTLRFRLIVDATNTIEEEAPVGETNNTKDFDFPVNIGIDGDFTIDPPTISYTENFNLVPKPFDIPSSCVYQSHQYRYTQNGSVSYSSAVTSRTQTTAIVYPNYPDNLSAGTMQIAIQIFTNCGNTGWINEKPIVIDDSGVNTPPEFRAGFFLEPDRSGTRPITQALLGQRLNLRIINDPNSSPPSPYDAESDYPITWNWDFAGSSSAWIRNLPSTYGFDRREEQFNNIVADTEGSFAIRVTGTDRRGAATSRTVFLDVIPPNPVPKANCPAYVKSNRPIDPLRFSSSQSYSPAGRSIDHSRDEWINRQTSYSNTTSENIQVQVHLWVWDTGSPALKSLFMDTCTITVEPDLPPIGQLDVPPLGLRGQTYELFNRSYSPDSDALVSAVYRYKYDAANNGFDDDAWQTLSGDMTKTSFTPSRVGRYLFDVTVCEAYGQCGSASSTQEVGSRTLNVINLAPSVSFDVSGKNEQPELNPIIPFSAADMLAWPLYDTNGETPQQNKPYRWSTEGDALISGLGKGMEKQFAQTWNSQSGGTGNPSKSYPNFAFFSDNGFGPNNITPYRGIAANTIDTERSQPILLPPKVSGNYVVGSPIDPTTPLSLVPLDADTNIQTTRTHLYFWLKDQNRSILLGYNKGRIPKYKSQEVVHSVPGVSSRTTLEHYWSDGVNPYDLAFPFGGGAVLDNRFPTRPVFYDSGNGHGYWQDERPAMKKFNTTIVGDKILVLYSVAYQTSCTYWEEYDEDGNTSNTGYDCTGEPPTYALAQFDAVDGHLIDDGFGRPISMPSFPSGISLDRYVSFGAVGNQLVVYMESSYSPAMLMYLFLDPDGTIVRQGSFHQPTYVMSNYVEKRKDIFGNIYNVPATNYTCQWGGSLLGGGLLSSSGSYTDDEGNVITYRTLTCRTSPSDPSKVFDPVLNPDQETGVYLIKYNIHDGTMTRSPRLQGTSTAPNTTGFAYPYETFPALAYHPEGYAFTRTFTQLDPHYQRVWLDGTNRVEPGREIANWDEHFNSPFHILPIGQIAEGNKCLYTASGTCERYDRHFDQLIFKETLSLDGGGGSYSDAKVRDWVHGQFIGDGQYMSIYGATHVFGAGGSGTGEVRGDRYLFLDIGAPNAARVYPGFRLGQLVSDASFDHIALNFTLQLKQARVDSDRAGFSFRMQDARNRYAVETDGSTLYLARYIGGSRTVLDSEAYPMQDRTDVTFTVRMGADKLEVLVGGVPYLEATDSTFASGKIGPVTDKSFAAFKAVSVQALPKQNVEWLTGYAIWEAGSATAEARYENISFTDPENDPRAGDFRWSIQHTPKFKQNQGLSALHGQTFTAPRQTFDKVGVYTLMLQARDDPHPSYLTPSMTFDEYRKDSNAFGRQLIVHRRPVAVMTATVQADGVVAYTDASYDPDRWVSAGDYSRPDTTGIDYGATRGILERKYYYLAPNGQYAEQKLTRPTMTGTYTVGLMVRDEYGAWSVPVETTISVGVIPPANDPPTATLTSPNGTYEMPNLSSARPAIYWMQEDTPGTIFQGYHVKISDSTGAVILESGERPQWTDHTIGFWIVPSDLPMSTKLQVQVRVSDGELWSSWSNIGWLIVNSPPTAVLTFPNGVSADSPTMLDTRRPTLTWNQYDPDLPYGSVFQYYHLQVRHVDGSPVGEYNGPQWTQDTSASYALAEDLPTGVPLQVRVRVLDIFGLWSEWSNVGWMRINLPPTAVITYPTGTQANPTVEGPTPTITWNQNDPDPDTVFLKYQLQIANEANTAVVYDTGELSQHTSATEMGHNVDVPLPNGQKLRVRVRVFDGYVWSAWSSETWLMINRPPVADFTWKVNPPTEVWEGVIWEGDHVLLINRSSDPDGDVLTSAWEVRLPDGSVQTFGTTDAALLFPLPGDYGVTLTVSDGSASSRTEKTLKASPLTIASEVAHTPEWEELHEAKGHNTTTVPKDFYSGELFVVWTISSPAPVASASASFEATGRDGRPLSLSTTLIQSSTDATRFEGTLYDDRLQSATEGLPEGELPIRFRIVYANGVVREQIVPVRIIGSVLAAFGVHRRQ